MDEQTSAIMERRTLEGFEVRADEEDEKPTIEGYAAIFNSPTEIRRGWFEQIKPGAFKESLKTVDTVATFNHVPAYVLGRKSKGTLVLEEDNKGLRYKIYPPDTQIGRDAVTNIKRGDVVGSSFGFDVWDGGEEVRTEKDGNIMRTLTKLGVGEVAPVTFPAYDNTSAFTRSIDRYLEEQEPPEKIPPMGEETPLRDLAEKELELAERNG